MNWLKSVLHEVFGLFVDDGGSAIAIVAWLAVLRLLATHLGFAARWSGFILFGGLVAILAEGALRYSRRTSR